MSNNRDDLMEEVEDINSIDFSHDFKMLGLRIAFFRKAKGWTQEELAYRMKMQVSTIGAIEAPNMTKKISLTTLFKFAKVLGVSPSTLLTFN